MFNTTYIKIKPDKYLFGQDARTKEWYCKELRGDTLKEIDQGINEANTICNKYNRQIQQKQKKKDNPQVKGLK